MILSFIAAAWAQDCDSIYTNDDFSTALSEVDRLMTKADVDRATDVLRQTENLLPCMEELVDVELLGRFGRHYALTSFLQQDADQAIRWAHMFLETAPDLGWGDTPEEHPLRNMIAAQPLEDPEPPGPDAGFAIEKKGAVFLNGRFTAQPVARDGMQHLVQIFQSGGYLVEARWQDGSVWADGMVDDSGPTPQPKFYDPATGKITTKGKAPPIAGTVAPKKSLPIVPLAAGAGLLVVSGALYAVAGVTKGQFKCNPADGGENCPATSEELTALRSRANLLVLGSGIALVGGLGVGVTGLFVAEEPVGLVFNGRF